MPYNLTLKRNQGIHVIFGKTAVAHRKNVFKEFSWYIGELAQNRIMNK